MWRSALTLATLFGSATVASAGVMVQIGTGTDVGDGLTSYDVRLVADTATGWQGDITGKFNNILFAGVVPTPSLDNAAFLGADAAKDTHFMFGSSDLLIITAPTETDEGSGVWSLSASIGFLPSIQSMDLLLAQVVLPAGETATMTSQTGRSDGMLFTTDAVIGVPEPTSIALLGAGTLLVFGRRRGSV